MAKRVVGKKEVFDSVQQKVVQKTSKRKKYDGLSDYVCTRCGNKISDFNYKNLKPCSQCKSTSFKRVMSFTSDEVTNVMNRQLLFVAIDGTEFINRLECEAWNHYTMGKSVEADKCPQCGTLYLVHKASRKNCEHCGLSSEYFKRGIVKRPILTSAHDLFLTH